MHDLVFRTTAESNQKLWIWILRTTKSQRNKFVAFDIVWSEWLLFVGNQVNKKDDRHLGSLFAPCKITFIVALSYRCDTFRSWKCGDEWLSFFVFVRGRESIEDDCISGGEDESVLAIVRGFEEERIFDLAVVMTDVFFDDWVLESRHRFLDFHSICNL